MEAKAASEEEIHGESWSSSTNWVVAEGSLDGAVSFETSAEDAAPIAGGLILQQPEGKEGENSSFCEVTVSLRGKHEIHRVYVRSTARVYEIYYATDHQNNNKEYLCTVRCGAVAKQVTPPFSAEGAFTECQDGNDETVDKNEAMTRSDSANSDEDGWVEVKAPESTLQDMPTHYEATAEISDASPCISLTVRLLSLQTKMFVHVEEIYIFADPVEVLDPNPSVTMGGDLGGSSLLAMLVPGLLQLSQSGTNRIHERYFSDNSGVRRYQSNADKATDPSSMAPGASTLQGGTSSMEDQTVGLVLEQTKSEPENEQLESSQKGIDQEAHSNMAEQKLGLVHEQTEKPASQKVIDPDHIPKSVIEENTIAYSRVEKVLDELVSRVGRTETFCSRFEENMMQPLSRIEMRLQQLEQRFNSYDAGIGTCKQGPSKISAPEFSYDESDSDACAVGNQSSKRIPSSKISAPEFSCDESESEAFAVGIQSSKSESATFAVGIQSSERDHSSKISAPDFSYEESDMENKICNTSCIVRENIACHAAPFTAQELATSASESGSCPGVEVEAPVFSNEHDECVNTDDTLDSGLKDCPKETPFSIDGALASALAAFLTSTTLSSEPGPNVMDKPNKLSDVDNGNLDSTPARAPEGADDLVSTSDTDNRVCSTLDEVKKGTTFSDPLSSAEVVADDNPFSESDLKDQDSNTPNAATEVAAFNDLSLLADGVGPAVSSFHMCPGLIIRAPEFPIEEGDFINCEDTSDPDVRDCPKNQPLNGPSTSALAQFLFSRKVEYPGSTISMGAPMELFNTDNYGPTFSASGAEELTSENRGGFAKADGLLNFLTPKASLEHNEHENLGQGISLLEMPVGRLIASCTPFGNSLEQNDHSMCSTAADVTETENFMQNFIHHGVLRSGNTVNYNKWVTESCLDDSDAEEVAHSGLSFNEEGKRWTEDSSTDSSFDENFIKSKVQIDWSDGSSTDSLREAFTVSQHSGQAVDNLRSTQASVERTIYGDDFTMHYDHEKLIGELGPALHSYDHEDLILDVKFARMRDWRKGLPLEVLLAETSNAGAQASAFQDNDTDAYISAGWHHNSYSRQREGPNSTTDNQLLVDVENDSVPTETAGMWSDLPQASVINDQQLFSSLI